MPNDRRRYDYGLRGVPAAAPPYYRSGPGGPPAYDYDMDRRLAPRTNRISAPYNIDYVYGARGGRYDRNYSMYTGDRPDRMGDERMYRSPYTTTGGTWTYRGSSGPTGYDAPDYGPSYGGRYPDELY